MGYCMNQIDAKFWIAEGMRMSALQAIKRMFADPETDFAWVDRDVVLTSNSFDEAMVEWGWDTEEDEQCNITGISFAAEKLGDEDELFDAIAPYVNSGSYIEMAGEDGERWRWVFKNGKCSQVAAKISFE